MLTHGRHNWWHIIDQWGAVIVGYSSLHLARCYWCTVVLKKKTEIKRDYMEGRRVTDGKKNGYRWEGEEINMMEKWVTAASTRRTHLLYLFFLQYLYLDKAYSKKWNKLYNKLINLLCGLTGRERSGHCAIVHGDLINVFL